MVLDGSFVGRTQMVVSRVVVVVWCGRIGFSSVQFLSQTKIITGFRKSSGSLFHGVQFVV